MGAEYGDDKIIGFGLRVLKPSQVATRVDIEYWIKYELDEEKLNKIKNILESE